MNTLAITRLFPPMAGFPISYVRALKLRWRSLRLVAKGPLILHGGRPPPPATSPLAAAPFTRSYPLSSWLRFCINVGAPANIKDRISHLAESKCAALEHAYAAAGAAAVKHPAA